jgi:hypothetical protein
MSFRAKQWTLVHGAVTAAKITEIQTLTGTTPFAQKASGTMQEVKIVVFASSV